MLTKLSRSKLEISLSIHNIQKKFSNTINVSAYFTDKLLVTTCIDTFIQYRFRFQSRN